MDFYRIDPRLLVAMRLEELAAERARERLAAAAAAPRAALPAAGWRERLTRWLAALVGWFDPAGPPPRRHDRRRATGWRLADAGVVADSGFRGRS